MKLFKPKLIKIKTFPETDDDYVDQCFKIEFQEFEENRDWFDMPEAKAVTESGNTGKIEEALILAKTMQNRHPDFWFPYFWRAILYSKKRNYKDVWKVLLEGLELSKSKFDLCAKLGNLEWELAEDLPEAIKWWAKSIVIQISAKEFLNRDASMARLRWNDSPFFYLSYVAEQLGLSRPFWKLRGYADQINIDKHCFIPEEAEKLYAAVHNQGTVSIGKVIELLSEKYLS